ncbi:MAG: Indolepyruvate oxidoreductase subunit IorB [Candidatus Ozemobacter sibiricus]|jgi:indolepyruvate ferredoxin oxidoreductase beta subunit|uniref:Indolepyruvate oxidoreductase subunit IorB n=1 Tax=Candidatus Ozemobacter sibiricus TaxID=2268124 RepID=A0A367ZT56_9BACT|nr:MAG: Indolepyruvate oxidoreductase subunit IorB [Candidatus Ozemobacter sibiricus]
MITNILLCGVGGQGTLLASNLLAECTMRAGFDVKKSEVHGMAQRGGSVVSHVRFGPAIHAPLIRQGEADILLAFEELEALRWAEYLKPNGLVLVNRQRILPMSVSAGSSVYPTEIISLLEKLPARVRAVPALDIAKELGNQKCVNVVLLGVLARQLPAIDRPTWDAALRERIPAKLLDLNVKAFERGWNAA